MLPLKHRCTDAVVDVSINRDQVPLGLIGGMSMRDGHKQVLSGPLERLLPILAMLAHTFLNDTPRLKQGHTSDFEGAS